MRLAFQALAVAGVQDQRVHRLGDRDERRLAVQLDQGQPGGLRGVGELGGQRRAEPAHQLDHQRGRAHTVQLVHVGAQAVRGVRQGDAGGQDQFAAVEQVRDVRDLGHVHPADRVLEPGVAGPHHRPAPLQAREGEHVGHRGKHAGEPTQCRLWMQMGDSLSVTARAHPP